MNWPQLRARFPVLQETAYLNAGTFGPLSHATLDAERELRGWEGEHGRAGKTYFEAMLERRDRVRALIAAQIRVSAENVALMDSTTRRRADVVAGLGLGRAATRS